MHTSSIQRYGHFIVRRRKQVLAVALIGVVAGVAALVSLSGRLKLESFVVPGTDAHAGTEILKREFGVAVPNFGLLVSARSGSVDDPLVAAEATAMVRRLESEPGVVDIVSYWTAGRPADLRSNGGNRALVVGRIEGSEKEAVARLKDLRPRYVSGGATIGVQVTGYTDFVREYAHLSKKELTRAEVFTGPVTLVALLVIFGSLVAASLPLLMAAVAVVGTAAVLYVISLFAAVSVFSFFLTSILGFGLALDYSLFVVSRFREELAAGHDSATAVVRTVRTAGRTVVFSAAAVAIALAALVPFPLNFMRSLGYSGIATALTAGLAALVVLPALLAVLGPNINRATVWKRSVQPVDGTGFWHRVAMVVMRRPLPVAGAVVAILLLVASPVLHLKPGLPDDRDLPEWSDARAVGEIFRSEFSGREGAPIPVVLPGVDVARRAGDVEGFAARLSEVPGVTRVETATGAYSNAVRTPLPDPTAARYVRPTATYLNVISSIEPVSSQGEQLIDAIRAVSSPFERVLVTGEGANAYDVKTAIVQSLPTGLVFIGLATFIILFIQFGCVLVPIKAIVLNALSLSALFGAMVWVFQDGHLAGVLDFTPTGLLYINVPIIIFCLAFGLSMDYEVFLLSRIKEEYDRTGDNEASVAMGLERSGRIVSAAAILIALVFLTTAAAGYTKFGKEFGLGLGLIVVGDAFLIRGTLVPALMKMAGSANWWAPAPLRRLHDRIGFSEHVDLSEDDLIDLLDESAEPMATRSSVDD